MLALRRQLPLPELNRALQDALLAWPGFREVRRVLCYAAFREEIDLTPLIAHCPEKQWYLPVTSPAGEVCSAPDPTGEPAMIPATAGRLTFYRYRAGEPLHSGRYGVPEPDPAIGEPLGAPEPGDLLLAPGLAFDRRGYRLGYGKGYYDRFLADAAGQGCALRTVGVVPLALVRDSLPADPWDVRVDFLLTERGVRSTDAL
jgi:5-formyltetrahydrofolate cyclo-ligase